MVLQLRFSRHRETSPSLPWSQARAAGTLPILTRIESRRVVAEPSRSSSTDPYTSGGATQRQQLFAVDLDRVPMDASTRRPAVALRGSNGEYRLQCIDKAIAAGRLHHPLARRGC